MKDRKEDGTEVLIFERNIWTGKENEKKFIRGTIVGCELSHDLSQHGSPWYENIYTILGEDTVNPFDKVVYTIENIEGGD